jgi:chromosome partitioning protein
MPVITFANSKGGPGKTTATACLASIWCGQGRKVALIDADPTRALSRWYSRAKERGTALASADLIECTDDESILATIRSAAQSHDYVLVDCPGATARLLVFAAGVADVVIIPAQPGEADLVEAIKTAKIVKQATELTQRDVECRVFLNRIDVRTHVGRHAIEQAKSQGLSLFSTSWADRVAFREGQYSGSTPSIDDPTGPADAEIAALANEVESYV